jgi:hypothetical protein
VSDYRGDVRRPRLRAALAAGALATLVIGAAGCRTDVTVDVQADRTGAGRLRVELVLDEAAAGAVRGRENPLRADDLSKAGWAVTDFAPADGGGVRASAEHAFTSPSEATALFDQLTGPDGPFASLALARTRGLLSTTVSLRGSVDLTKGLAAFGDEQLRSATGGVSPLGVDQGAIERQAGAPVADAFRLRLVTSLDGASQEQALPLGALTPVAVSQTRRAVEALPFALAGVSALVWLALLLRRRSDA